jgi:hypothetical protein
MPSEAQLLAYNRIKTLFGHTTRWKALTSRDYFDSLARHAATHHLYALLGEFLDIHIPCGLRGETGLPTIAPMDPKEPVGWKQPDLLATPALV